MVNTKGRHARLGNRNRRSISPTLGWTFFGLCLRLGQSASWRAARNAFGPILGKGFVGSEGWLVAAVFFVRWHTGLDRHGRNVSVVCASNEASVALCSHWSSSWFRYNHFWLRAHLFSCMPATRHDNPVAGLLLRSVCWVGHGPGCVADLCLRKHRSLVQKFAPINQQRSKPCNPNSGRFGKTYVR